MKSEQFRHYLPREERWMSVEQNSRVDDVYTEKTIPSKYTVSRYPPVYSTTGQWVIAKHQRLVYTQSVSVILSYVSLVLTNRINKHRGLSSPNVECKSIEAEAFVSEGINASLIRVHQTILTDSFWSTSENRWTRDALNQSWLIEMSLCQSSSGKSQMRRSSPLGMSELILPDVCISWGLNVVFLFWQRQGNFLFITLVCDLSHVSRFYVGLPATMFHTLWNDRISHPR